MADSFRNTAGAADKASLLHQAVLLAGLLQGLEHIGDSALSGRTDRESVLLLDGVEVARAAAQKLANAIDVFRV
jgi:hypothetical protein